MYILLTAKVNSGIILSIIILATQTQISSARIVTRCELTRELLKQHVPRSLLSNWVCIAEGGSGGNTATSVGPNKDGSFQLGIFKINSKWCRKGYKGGECNLRCEVLTDNTVADDISCAKKIHNRGGFAAWPEWTAKCKGKPLPIVSDCYKP